MIIQSNVAQPQIIQRTPQLDSFLARLVALAQIGGEAMKGYNYYKAAESAARPNWQATMEAIKSLPDDQLVPFLRSQKVNEEHIKGILAAKGRAANYAHDMVMRTHDMNPNQDLSTDEGRRNLQYYMGTSTPAATPAPTEHATPAPVAAPPMFQAPEPPSPSAYFPGGGVMSYSPLDDFLSSLQSWRTA